MAFILVLHCPGSGGSLCGSNNFPRSSSDMQNIPDNDTGCFGSLHGCLFISLFGHTHSPLKAPFQRWSGSPRDSWDRRTSVPAEDESQVPEGSRAGWRHRPGALVWASLQPHWQEGPCRSQPCNPRLEGQRAPERGNVPRPLSPTLQALADGRWPFSLQAGGQHCCF